jgi:hypothetical protein
MVDTYVDAVHRVIHTCARERTRLRSALQSHPAKLDRTPGENHESGTLTTARSDHKST